MSTITEQLLALRDREYSAFMSRLIPSVETDKIIGIRTPELKKQAKDFSKQEGCESFLSALPHRYFEENQLHAFILSKYKDFDSCISQVCLFLPYVDNWATCDQMSPKAFRKHQPDLLPYIREWISSDRTYTVRFAMKTLMDHYLDAFYDTQYSDLVCSVQSEEYYINMMRAWYFATGLAKQYESFLPYIEEYRLDKWTHNKTIQKAIESYRVADEQKAYLNTFRVRYT